MRHRRSLGDLLPGNKDKLRENYFQIATAVTAPDLQGLKMKLAQPDTQKIGNLVILFRDLVQKLKIDIITYIPVSYTHLTLPTNREV